jgi:hypothetical protein
VPARVAVALSAELIRVNPQARAAIAEARKRPPVAKGSPKLSDGYDSQLEREYAAVLEAQRVAGEILWWKHHAMRLRLANETFYSTDFLVMLPSHELELHECKGFIRESARVRVNVIAEMYPFRVVMVRAERYRGTYSNWTYEVV